MKFRLQVVFALLLISASVFAKDTDTEERTGSQCTERVCFRENKEPILTECTKRESAYFAEASRLIQRCPNDSTCLKCEAYLQLKNYLLAHPELIHRYNCQHETLVFIATKWDNGHIIKLLSENGASLDIQNLNGDTPLLSAIQQNSIDAVVVLLSLGANANIKNKENYDAYQLACTLPDTKILSVLNRYCKVHNLTTKSKSK